MFSYLQLLINSNNSRLTPSFKKKEEKKERERKKRKKKTVKSVKFNINPRRIPVQQSQNKRNCPEDKFY